MSTRAADLLSDAWGVIRKNIDWRTRSYSVDKAYFCALFSRLAYSHVPAFELADRGRVKLVPCYAYQEIARRGVATDIRVALADGEFMEFFIIERRFAIVVGVRAPDVVVVAIRGTKFLSVYDWKANFSAWRHPLPLFENTMRVHQGFFRAIASCFQELSEKLHPYVEAGIPIYATGHSLGGAMVGILDAVWGRPRHFWMGRDGEPIDSCYTFGMPKYGDLNVVAWLPTPYHIYNWEDIVPRVPPWWAGYTPCLRERVAMDCDIKEIDSAERPDYLAFWYKVLTGKAISAHYMEEYLKRIHCALAPAPRPHARIS
jgi:hypothetical protein